MVVVVCVPRYTRDRRWRVALGFCAASAERLLFCACRANVRIMEVVLLWRCRFDFATCRCCRAALLRTDAPPG
eukprot:11191910-Lingulodinium_polyedra.AAC.1